MKIDEQKKAFNAGYDSDIIPESIQIYLDELKSLLEDLNSKNERLFNVNLTIRSYAKTKQKAELQLINYLVSLKKITARL